MLRSVAIGIASLLTTSAISCPAVSAATLYVADFGTIHKVDTLTGAISVLNATKNVNGITEIEHPTGLTFDQYGTLWETELNDGIRKIDVTTGVVTRFKTSVDLVSPSALAFDRNGIMWEVGYLQGIHKIDPVTGVVTDFLTNGSLGGGFSTIAGLAFDKNNTLWAADKTGGISKINTTTGVVTPFTTYGGGLNDGHICPALPQANGLTCPVGLAFDNSGVLWEADYAGSINTIDPITGIVTPFFQSGKPANFSHTFGLAIAPSSVSANNTISANDTAAVPEPFTIVGTLIGGTTAMRMRKKLKNAGKD
jgi:streptogramin lyase